MLDGTYARKQGPRREGGEGGQNGDGGGSSSWAKRAANHGGIRGAERASEGAGVGARQGAHLLATRKVDRPEAAAPAKQQAGEVDEWGKAGLERVQAGEVLG